jgi:hypothetical protein
MSETGLGSQAEAALTWAFGVDDVLKETGIATRVKGKRPVANEPSRMKRP